MDTDAGLLLSFLVAIGAAWVAGMGARRLRAPLLVGYIGAGVVIGPRLLGLVQADDTVQSMASLGVILLLFALGVELSPRDLLAVRKVAIAGGGLQVALTIVLGYLVGLGLGWAPTARVVLGFAVALGSTAVIVKLLSERGEVHTQHARVVVGINVTQDLAAVVLVGVLPVLGSLAMGTTRPWALAGELGLLAAKGTVFLAIVLFLARIVVPRLLHRVARTGSRELFLTTTIVLCAAGADIAHVLGFSLALGAFLAGMMVSESDFRHQAFAHVAPLRDVFGLLFFVSLGMFLDPRVLVQDAWQVGAIVLAVVVGKVLIVIALVLWAGYHLRTAIMSGLALGQIGEFSFVIIQIALQRGYVDESGYSVIIAAAVISMMLTPLMMHLSRPLYRQAIKLALFRRLTRAAREEPELARARAERDYVLLCGYGRVGRVAAEVLQHFGVRLMVIDYDQHHVEQLRREGVLALYGDVSSSLLLAQAGVEDARAAILALPESRDTLLALRHLTQLNPQMPKVARGTVLFDLLNCYESGAEEVVVPEVECGLELARHALLRLGYDPEAVQQYVDDVRVTRYRCGVPEEGVVS